MQQPSPEPPPSAGGPSRLVRFRIDGTFWSLFPNAYVGAVVVGGINNTRSVERCRAILHEAAHEAALKVEGRDIGTLPAVTPWRDAYRTFGVKPTKHRPSIESLLRATRAQGMPSVNPLVDLYNAVSLKHLLPCGGEDLAAVHGDVRLSRADGGEVFVPLGAREPQPPLPGEVIYRDDIGVLCRCWNWREAERTKLSSATAAAFLCVEALPPMGAVEVRAACDELVALVRENLGGQASIKILSCNDPLVSYQLEQKEFAHR